LRGDPCFEKIVASSRRSNVPGSTGRRAVVRGILPQTDLNVRRLRDAFRLAAENGRLAARDPQSATSATLWFLEKSPNFPRNEPPNPAKYFSEQPEMTFHDESKKAKTRKGN
jgi:hypothetical protein